MTQTEEQQTAETPQEMATTPLIVKPKPPIIQFWYHEADIKLIEPINPYSAHLFRRLGGQVGSYSFRYRDLTEPARPKEEYLQRHYEEILAQYEKDTLTNQQQHATALAALERTILLVPCVSNAFLEAFDHDLKTTPELAQILEQPRFQIMPVVVRPTETGETSQRPLCTYAEGAERDTALKELVRLIEVLLCNALHIEPRQTSLDLLFHSSSTVLPAIESQKTTMDLVLEALEPVKNLVAQTSTQIVEARQLALTEHAEQQTYQALAQQVEALSQQLQAQQSGFWSRFRAKKS